MATTEPPDKQDRGRSRKRRYFRRRRRKGSRDASLAAEQSAAGAEVQPEQRRRSKSQNRRRSENRRRSSRRRGRAARVQESQARPAEEENQPQTEVYIYTHVIRPTYKDGGSGEFQADHSLNLAGATAVGPPVGMEYLLDSIGQQLDEWFGLPDDSTTEDNEDGEVNKPSADLTEDGEAREEVHGSGQETADENRASEDSSFSE
ncbi:MAG: hypothetical protein OXK78_17085 [Caldilineaceae bacterium]|nr:hypothetical protein [Caldilineaceae bacterium]